MTAAINKSGDGIFIPLIPMMIQASVLTVKIYRKTLYCLIPVSYTHLTLPTT